MDIFAYMIVVFLETTTNNKILFSSITYFSSSCKTQNNVYNATIIQYKIKFLFIFKNFHVY